MEFYQNFFEIEHEHLTQKHKLKGKHLAGWTFIKESSCERLAHKLEHEGSKANIDHKQTFAPTQDASHSCIYTRRIFSFWALTCFPPSQMSRWKHKDISPCVEKASGSINIERPGNSRAFDPTPSLGSGGLGIKGFLIPEAFLKQCLKGTAIAALGAVFSLSFEWPVPEALVGGTTSSLSELKPSGLHTCLR